MPTQCTVTAHRSWGEPNEEKELARLRAPAPCPLALSCFSPIPTKHTPYSSPSPHPIPDGITPQTQLPAPSPPARLPTENSNVPSLEERPLPLCPDLRDPLHAHQRSLHQVAVVDDRDVAALLKVESRVLFKETRVRFVPSSELRARDGEGERTIVISLPAALRNALVHLSFLGFLFILRSLDPSAPVPSLDTARAHALEVLVALGAAESKALAVVTHEHRSMAGLFEHHGQLPLNVLPL